MKIQRYGLGREYAGNTGSPAITEQADGAYVRYEDFQKMEAAHKAHNEMLVLRTKKAEDAQAQQNAEKVNACVAPVSYKPDCGAQNAKCERQADKVDAQPSDDEIVSMSKALIAQRGADATDAERYRWLVGHSMPSVGYPYKCTIRLPRGYSDKESLDAAIDQAMQQEPRP